LRGGRSITTLSAGIVVHDDGHIIIIITITKVSPCGLWLTEKLRADEAIEVAVAGWPLHHHALGRLPREGDRRRHLLDSKND
jgi:hypothetical protein